MRKNALLFITFAAMLGSSGAMAQPNKWGGAEPPAPAVKGQPPAAATPTQRDLFSCYAHRAKSGSTWEIACTKGRPAACEQAKTSYVNSNRNMEVIGCSPSIACFAYNPGGTANSCYVDMAACNAARNKMAQSGGNPANLGNCVANQASGAPTVAMPTSSGSGSAAGTGPKTCFASTFGPGRVQVRCYSFPEECPSAVNQSKTVILGCNPAPFFCFAYNSNTSGACFTEKQACDNARVRLGNQTKPGSVGFCYQYDDGGVVSM